MVIKMMILLKNRSNNNSNDAGNRTNRSGKGLGKTIFYDWS